MLNAHTVTFLQCAGEEGKRLTLFPPVCGATRGGGPALCDAIAELIELQRDKMNEALALLVVYMNAD